jgi:hypothetical protein
MREVFSVLVPVTVIVAGHRRIWRNDGKSDRKLQRNVFVLRMQMRGTVKSGYTFLSTSTVKVYNII